jgi:hypothetical protein
MVRNESTADRVIRVIIGLILGYLAYAHVGGTVGVWIFAILGLISFVTGVTGFCGLYRLIGISTCPVTPQKQH